MYAYCSFRYLLWRNVYQILCSFLKLDCHSITKLWESLYIPDTRFLLATWFANIFSHSLGYLFSFLIVSRYFFWNHGLLSLKKIVFTIFNVVLVCLCSLFVNLQWVNLANVKLSVDEWHTILFVILSWSFLSQHITLCRHRKYRMTSPS